MDRLGRWTHNTYGQTYHYSKKLYSLTNYCLQSPLQWPWHTFAWFTSKQNLGPHLSGLYIIQNLEQNDLQMTAKNKNALLEHWPYFVDSSIPCNWWWFTQRPSFNLYLIPSSILKVDFSLKKTQKHIHLYFIATKYLWKNALMEYIDNSYSLVIK